MSAKPQTIKQINNRLAAAGRTVRVITRLERQRAEFACSCGHHWITTISAILNQGQNCRKCFTKKLTEIKAIPLAEYNKQLEPRNIVMTNRLPGSYAEFKCLCGHVWETTISSVISAGHGCSQCASSGPRKGAGVFVYVMQYGRRSRPLTKIGVAVNCSRRRTRLERSFGKPVRIRFIFAFGDGVAKDVYKIEKAAHKHFASRHAKMSGFEGSAELFRITAEDAADYLRTMGGATIFES